MVKTPRASERRGKKSVLVSYLQAKLRNKFHVLRDDLFKLCLREYDCIKKRARERYSVALTPFNLWPLVFMSKCWHQRQDLERVWDARGWRLEQGHLCQKRGLFVYNTIKRPDRFSVTILVWPPFVSASCVSVCLLGTPVSWTLAITLLALSIAKSVLVDPPFRSAVMPHPPHVQWQPNTKSQRDS